MFQIVVFVDVDHCAQVRNALFSRGAGAIGAYQNCCFVTMGTGQFKANQGAKPFIGSIDELEKVSEVRLEMVCSKENLKSAIEAMLESHPYETPAYYVVPHFDWRNVS